ncbi:MAG: hypothetical protein LBI64_01665 [Coriobacteriales bacterium]|jgi:drug/metabolite transporter (DMT)-like permease|nr:hypothetical protein [Coriobacteriales bacterium]
MNDSQQLAEARRARTSSFFKKGVLIAIASGILYGVYGSFLTGATFWGEWIPWYGYLEGAQGAGWYDAGTSAIITNTLGTYAMPMSFLMAVLILGALGSGLNDFFSAIWMLIKAAIQGRLADFGRCFKSKPGLVMIVCALIGGPIASTAFLIALIMAGPIATPISALCPAIGAIIGRIIFKQELNFRMACGIVVCVIATFMIGSTAFTGLELTDPMFLAGLAVALISALGWGIEGAVAGFGTSVIDYNISITIRQVTSGVVTLFILVPVLFLFAGNVGLYPTMVIDALTGPLFTDGVLSSPLIILLISGLAAGLSFAFWYKGNSMCGAALGMACNGMFSFWVPFFSFLVLGLYMGGGEAYFLAPIQWAAAIVMVIGIFLIAVNPLDWFKKDKEA